MATAIRQFSPETDLTQVEVTLTLVGALATLVTPFVLWVRFVARDVWPSTPRAIETQQRLRKTVLYSAAAAGIGALLVELFEVVLERHGIGVARPFWAFLVVGAAALVLIVTWLMTSPRRAKG